MKKILVFTLLFSMVFAQHPDIGIQHVSADDQLVIYTYDSLLADPAYDFVGNFSAFAGIDKDSIRVEYLSDAGAVMSKANTEKDTPVADVLIGLDNAMVGKARDLNILEPYKPQGVENIKEELIAGLADDFLLTPYDYGVISLWYDTERFEGFGDSFTLSDLLAPEIRQKLVIENPTVSSPGLGFLLWSLAEYNHSTLGGTDRSWRNFWDTLREDTLLVDSWGDAINVFFTPEANRSIMVSYTSSPAYGYCQGWGDTSDAVISTHEDGTYGWMQIEGIGLAKGAPHQEMAKKFIDWFISEDLQKEIYQSQWMYPAHKTVETPDCYKDVTYTPEQIKAYNNEISQESIEAYLDTWLDEWEITWAGINENPLPLPFIWFVTGAIVYNLARRRKE